RRVVPDVDAGDEVRRIADEPRILRLVGGARLSSQRRAGHHALDDGRSAALHNTFEDRGHLERGVRVNDLLAVVRDLRLLLAAPLLSRAAQALALVVAPDRAAPAILDAIDQSRPDLPAA